jgi:uncharacterized surface protein with fasciclin (FAS1) repeats
MKIKNLFRITLLLIVPVLFTSCQREQVQDDSSQLSPVKESKSTKSGQAFIEDDGSTPNVLQIAIGSKDHSTLVAAVQAAGLENALVNAGPLMVFAPTNAAFDALPEGTVAELLKPENKDKLAAILKHHVTAGNYTKEFLKNFKKIGQADDTNAKVEVIGDDVFVGGAKILASIKAGNGIVHVVDKVILPVSAK